MALVQGTMLYAAELTWSGQKSIEGEYQRAINRMARSTLGAFRSTPQGILAAESGLNPARALLEYQQARFAHRLLAQPRDGGGPEEILTREGAGITTRIRAAAGTRRGEAMELPVRSEGRAFLGGVAIQERDQALAVARSCRWDNPNTVWTDGSRLDSRDVGAACAWNNDGEWVG